MTSTEEKYPLLYKDKHIAATLRGFKDILLNYDKKARFDLSKKMLSERKKRYKDKISNASTISRILKQDSSFADEFGIDVNKFEKSLEAIIDYYNSEIRHKRTNANYIIFFYQEFIYFHLHRFGWGQSKQIELMYDLFMECDYRGKYSKIKEIPTDKMRDRVIKTFKDTIRKSQEKFLKLRIPWEYGTE